MKHELKTDPEVFQEVQVDRKTFEIRFDDRDFSVGDTLVLRETFYTGEEMRIGRPLLYTGNVEIRIVTHKLLGPIYGLMDGWCILSIKRP